MQILIEETEYERFQAHAHRQGKTLAEWVREALRDNARRLPATKAHDKQTVLREAAQHSFPAPDIDRMNDEIEGGYLSDSFSDSAP